MFSASSVGAGTGSGTEMEAMEVTGASSSSSSSSSLPGAEDGSESEKWWKMRLMGGMLWMHSRQQHQQHMAQAYRFRVESFTYDELLPNFFSDVFRVHV